MASWLKRLGNSFGDDNKGLKYVAAGTVISSGLGGLAWFIFATLLQVASYGEIAFLISVGALSGTVITFGGNTSLTATLARNDNRLRPAVHLVVILILGPANLLLYYFGDSIFLNLFATGLALALVSEGIILGSRNYRNYALFLILQKASGIALAIGMNFIVGPQGILLGYAIGSFAFSFPFFISLRRFGVSFTSLKENIVFMTHSYSTEISRMVTMFSDKIIIGPIFGYIILGYYQLASQILLLIGMFSLILYTYSLPEESSRKETVWKLKKVVLVSAAIVAVYVVSAPAVVPFIFPNFQESVLPSQIMATGLVPLAINYNLTSAFIARNKSKHVFMASAIYISSQISLFYILGVMLGLSGLALALPLSLAAQAAYYLSVRQRINDQPSDKL